MGYRDVSPTDPDPKERVESAGRIAKSITPEDSDPPPPPKK